MPVPERWLTSWRIPLLTLPSGGPGRCMGRGRICQWTSAVSSPPRRLGFHAVAFMTRGEGGCSWYARLWVLCWPVFGWFNDTRASPVPRGLPNCGTDSVTGYGCIEVGRLFLLCKSLISFWFLCLPIFVFIFYFVVDVVVVVVVVVVF